MKNLKTILKVSLLSLSLMLPTFSYSQEALEKEIESKIEDVGKNVEIIHVTEDDPLLTLISEKDGEVCDPANPVFEPNKNFKDVFRHLIKDTGAILLAPIGWKKDDWLKASFVVAGLAILSTQDSNIKRLSQSIRNDTTDKFSIPLEKMGNGGTMLGLLGATYVTTLVIKDQKLKNTTLTAIEGLALSAVLTTIGKKVFHRQRPNKTDDQYHFSGPGFGGSDVSFPSGHTGTVFAVATVFAEAYGHTKFGPLIAYTGASLAGLSRIHDNKHWFTDVLGGAVLGYVSGKLVSNRRLDRKNDSQKIKVTPSFNLGKDSGVNLSLKIPLGDKRKKG